MKLFRGNGSRCLYEVNGNVVVMHSQISPGILECWKSTEQQFRENYSATLIGVNVKLKRALNARRENV